MALRKLDDQEREILSDKIAQLSALHKEAVEKDAAAYSYDWLQLDRAITQAILEYRHVLATTECVVH